MDFSFQLYSARNFPPLDSILKRVAKLGYRQVEGFGGLYAEAESLAASLKQHGLTMPTGHFGLAQLKDTDAALKTAETLGMRFLYCPAIPKEDRSPDEAKWVELADAVKQQIAAYCDGSDPLPALLRGVIEFCLPLRGRHWRWDYVPN